MTFDEQYFATHYGDYERQNPARKLDWYVRTAERWVDTDPIRHLDVGCGLGAFAAHAARRGWDVHATDVSDHGTEKTRAAAPTAEVLVAPAHARPWPDDSFDVITALDVLEHLPELDATLDAIHAMLRPSGVLVAVVPVYDGLSGPVIRRLDSDPTHIHKWARREWIERLGSSFEILSWDGAFRLLPPVGPYLHFPTRRLRGHTPAILMAGRSR